MGPSAAFTLRVLVHGLGEIDRVEDLDLIPIVQQHFSTLGHDASFRIGHDKTDRILL